VAPSRIRPTAAAANARRKTLGCGGSVGFIVVLITAVFAADVTASITFEVVV
jgi:hypothetical protein